jgi:peptidyl-prolyl cis-trans isomerase SurA
MKSRLLILMLLSLGHACLGAAQEAQARARAITNAAPESDRPAANGVQPFRGTGIAAIANQSIITYSEVGMLVEPSIPRIRLMHRNNPTQQEAEYWKVVNDATEHLVERQLILDDFKTSGLVFPESLIDEQINDIIREKYGSRASLTKSLQAEGMTTEGFRQQRREDLILRAMEGRNVREALIISPAKIEAYYRTNLAKYKLDDQLRLRGIVLKCDAISTSDEVLALARDIHRKISAGESFADMAATYSKGSQARDGGDWGWQETSKLSQGFADVSAGLEAGKHSGIISRAPDGEKGYWIYFYDDAGRITRGRRYAINEGKEAFAEEKAFTGQANHDGLPAQPVEFYLLKVEEKKIAHTKSLNDLRDEIEKDLLVQERARLRGKWIDRLKTKAFVRRF